MPLTDELCRSFLDSWWHFDPAAATRAGVPGYDGRLGAFDDESLRAHAAAFRAIAAAVEDLEVSELADEIDRTALLDHLRVLLFRFEHEHPWRRNPALWLEHLADAFDGLLAREGGDAEGLAADARDRLAAVPGFLAALRGTLEAPPRFLVETALAQLPGLGKLVGEVGEVGGVGEVGAAQEALTQLGSFLKGLDPDPDPYGAAIGEDEVDRRLHYEHASIHNGAEAWRGALRRAGEAEAAVIALAAELEPGRPWREVYLALCEEDVVGSELAARVQDALGACRAAAEAGGLAESAPALALRPLREAALVLEPLACYRPAGLATSAAILLGDLEPAAASALAARFGVPGLHLLRSRTAALPGMVRRHIAAPSTPFGWALYAADLMAELGFAADPAERLVEGVLQLREAHLGLVDLGLHTRQLTAEEAVQHLVAQTPADAGSALADVRRLACRPLSASAALLGYRELSRLRDDFRAASGDGFTLGGFHQELFAYGGLPVPLIRWGMGL